MSLRKMVRARDERFNTPRQMDATERPLETKRICLECRRTPLPPSKRRGKCPFCGGLIVEITW